MVGGLWCTAVGLLQSCPHTLLTQIPPRHSPPVLFSLPLGHCVWSAPGLGGFQLPSCSGPDPRELAPLRSAMSPGVMQPPSFPTAAPSPALAGIRLWLCPCSVGSRCVSGYGGWQAMPVQAEEWAGSQRPDHWGHGIREGASGHNLLPLNGEEATGLSPHLQLFSPLQPRSPPPRWLKSGLEPRDALLTISQPPGRTLFLLVYSCDSMDNSGSW